MKKADDIATLIAACDRFDKTQVDLLISQNKSLLQQTHNGLPVLCHVTLSAALTSRQKAKLCKRLLKNGADINARMPNSQKSVLHLAAANNDITLLSLFLDYAPTTEMTDISGVTPLHHVSAFADANACLLLLIQAGANVNARDHLGCTPCHAASIKMAIPNVITLLENGANPFVIDNEGKTIVYANPLLPDYSSRQPLVEVLKTHLKLGERLPKFSEPRIAELEADIIRFKELIKCQADFEGMRGLERAELVNLINSLRGGFTGYPHARLKELKATLDYGTCWERTLQTAAARFDKQVCLHALRALVMQQENGGHLNYLLKQGSGNYEYYMRWTTNLDIIYTSSKGRAPLQVPGNQHHLKLCEAENTLRIALQVTGKWKHGGTNMVAANIGFICAVKGTNDTNYGEKTFVTFPIHAKTKLGGIESKISHRKYCDVYEVIGAKSQQAVVASETYKVAMLDMLASAETSMLDEKPDAAMEKNFIPPEKKKIEDWQQFFHSETALYLYAHQADFSSRMLTQLAKHFDAVLKQDALVRVYAVIFDIFSTKYVCWRCSELGFGLQSRHGRFVEHMVRAIAKDKRFTVTKKTADREKSLRVLMRYSAIEKGQKRSEPQADDFVANATLNDKSELFNKVMLHACVSPQPFNANLRPLEGDDKRTFFLSGDTGADNREKRSAKFHSQESERRLSDQQVLQRELDATRGAFGGMMLDSP